MVGLHMGGDVVGDVQPSLKGGRHLPSPPIGVYGPRLSVRCWWCQQHV